MPLHDRHMLSFAILLVLAATAGRSRAQVLHTLASPHPEAQGWFGRSVAGAGDVNGDGYSDVLVGAPYEDLPDGTVNAGRAYLFDGITGDTLITLVSPHPEEGGEFGCAVSALGDVDGDGFDDVVVGAWNENPGTSPIDAGRVYVFSSGTGQVLHALESPNEEIDGLFGCAVAAAGDVDADGYADVIVGADWEDPDTSPAGAGRAYVFSGRTGGLLQTLASPQETASGCFGYSVASIGDADGDSVPDIAVGAVWEGNGPGLGNAGRAYVFSGTTGTLLHSLVSPNPRENGGFGRSVAGVGDVDGDGRGDVLVGASGEGGDPDPLYAGRAYIFSGETGHVVCAMHSPNQQTRGWFGYAAADVDDVNGDSVPDVAVSAYGESVLPNGRGPGAAYVFSGNCGEVLCTITSADPDSEGVFGWSLAAAGDVNGDGLTDLVIGAPGESPDGGPQGAGQVYVIDIAGLPAGDPHTTAPTFPLVVLRGPFPNPSSAEACLTLNASGEQDCEVTLSLYDVLGRLVAVPGRYAVPGGASLTVHWRAGPDLPPGLYWWTLSAGNHVLRKPMVFVR
jgi:hypothetical protein